MTPYLPTLHNLLGVAGLAMTLVLFVALGAAVTARRTCRRSSSSRVGDLPAWCSPSGRSSRRCRWRYRLAFLARQRLICLAHPAIAPADRPDARHPAPAVAQPAALAGHAAGAAVADRHLAQSAAERGLSVRLRNVADRRAAAQLLVPAGGAVQYAVRGIHRLARIRLVRRRAMALFSVALLCASGMLFARVVSGRGATPPWWACAAGLLLAIFLNPGFVPRVFFASYGEASLAVTALFAVWLAGDTDRRTGARRARGRARMSALALVLAALVNIKQSGIGLLLSIGVDAAGLGPAASTRAPRTRCLRRCGDACVPALALYLIWRDFVPGQLRRRRIEAAAVRRVEFRPAAADCSPASLVTMFQKATFFLCMAGGWCRRAVVAPRSAGVATALLLGVAAGVIVLFNGFLLFTYIAHFPPAMAAQAHSYFRYASQLSLLVMLGLIVALRPLWRDGWRAWAPRAVCRALRPCCWSCCCRGHRRHAALRSRCAAADRLGARPSGRAASSHRATGSPCWCPVIPTIRSAACCAACCCSRRRSRPRLDIRTETKADAATLDSARPRRISLALVSCTPAGLAGVPPHEAAMLRRSGKGWRCWTAWRYPAGLERQKFSALACPWPALRGGRFAQWIGFDGCVVGAAGEIAIRPALSLRGALRRGDLALRRRPMSTVSG